ncbi:MAG: UDP-N-acetylmuramate--L-alanine ligase [Prevotellaceae bacterium]|jgi:UDP-N-acetylmuramate--alanine ligase|nr:UDP-N-acetylmuramate--L-alanine ligase [Prevotellaceae bacterium]
MNYYFLGIGGIGMSAIARYFAGKGCATAGYDRLRSELCAELESENIDIHYIDDIELIDKKFLNPEETLVIYTPAIPNEHAEYQYFRQNNFKILKRAEILGQITKTERGLCIAGTHGKTTISTMTAHLFKQSSIDCSAFLGGISLNYNNNLLLSNRSDLVVIEADEYDRSFHQLTPCMAVISATDADHLDIYHTHNEYISAFEKFTSLIVEGGALIYKKGTKLEPKVQKNVKVYDYSATEKADFYAENIFYEYGHLLFDFVTPKGKIECIDLGVPMLINVENAVAAMALAWLNGMSAEEISHGIASYRGVKRRFEKHLSEPKIFIDDYAHHPQELEQSIKSVKKLYPDKKVLGVFQPHLYSRTQDFYCEFASALSNLDEIVLVEIYPAREKPIEGVTSQLIYNQIDNPHKTLTSKTKLLDVLAEKDFDVLLTLGAGDIDAYIPKIKDLLTREGTKAQKSKRQGINKICTFVHSYNNKQNKKFTKNNINFGAFWRFWYNFCSKQQRKQRY